MGLGSGIKPIPDPGPGSKRHRDPGSGKLPLWGKVHT